MKTRLIQLFQCIIKMKRRDYFEKLEMPSTVFCRKVNLSTASYYKWKDGIFEA